MTEAETEARNAMIADLYQRHAGQVRHVGLARLRNDDLADEVVQGTYERALRHWRVLAAQPCPHKREGWLVTVAAHLIVDLVRSGAFRLSVGYDPVAHDRPSSRIDECPEAAALANERVAALGTVIAQLPDVDRQTLIICARDKQPDIIGLSRHMGITRQAGKSRAYRARDRAQRYCADVDLTA